MSHLEFPHAQARHWVDEFAEYMCQTIALRDLLHHGVNPTSIQRPMTALATALVARSEDLAIHGLQAGAGLSEIEEELWEHTVRYASEVRWLVPPAGVPVDELLADQAAMQAAWTRLEDFVKRLPENVSTSSVVLASGTELRGAGLAELFSPRVSPTAIVG